MPTPDTETLAARLRAVERALTDDDAVLDPPSDDVAGPDPDPETAVPSGASGPESEVDERLCRLEAAVQALRAALDESDTETEPVGDEPPEPPDRPAETATDRRDTGGRRPESASGAAADGAMDIPVDPTPGHEPRELTTTDWPDDLAAE